MLGPAMTLTSTAWRAACTLALPFRFVHCVDQRRGIDSIKDVQHPSLAAMHQNFSQTALIDDVGQHRRCGPVVISQVVMHFLEMPLANAALEIERNDRSGKTNCGCPAWFRLCQATDGLLTRTPSRAPDR